MKICIPIVENKGVSAKVSAHFGSAPYFLIFDTDSAGSVVIKNSGSHHAHGMCQPLEMLSDQQIGIVVCRGMGARAVELLNRGGIWVYRADGETAEEVIKKSKEGKLKAITVQNACTDHNCHVSSPPDYNI